MSSSSKIRRRTLLSIAQEFFFILILELHFNIRGKQSPQWPKQNFCIKHCLYSTNSLQEFRDTEKAVSL